MPKRSKSRFMKSPSTKLQGPARRQAPRPRHVSLWTTVLAAALVTLSAACDTEAGAQATCREPVTGLVTLSVTDGLVFDTGAVTNEAEAMTSDLVSYKSGSTVDLKSGIEVGTTDRLPLHWFRSPGGVGIRYESIAEVPWEAPTTENLNEFLHGPEPGYGFVVANLLSRGAYTRVFVDDYNDATGAVSLRYETVPPACD